MKRKIIIFVVSAIFLTLLGTALLRRQQLSIEGEVRVYIPTGSSYRDLVDSLDAHGCIVNRGVFGTLSRLRGLSSHVKSGSYLFHHNQGVISVVQKLYSGSQDPIRVTIGKYRTPEQLCQYLDGKLELSGDSLLHLMRTDSICALYGLTPATIFCLFPQNTYEFYWNMSPQGFLDRMSKEYDRFWRGRQQQADNMKLSRQEVVTLASIVEEETNASSEKPDIASVYLNRLRIGMPLQADPTVKYASGDFAARRIRGAMLSSDSPYNTYRHRGLPPGPICIPSQASVDAVLQNKKTGYIYFCAKEDFSGRHNFAATLAEHNANAARFHQALNRRGIQK